MSHLPEYFEDMPPDPARRIKIAEAIAGLESAIRGTGDNLFSLLLTLTASSTRPEQGYLAATEAGLRRQLHQYYQQLRFLLRYQADLSSLLPMMARLESLIRAFRQVSVHFQASR
jgi:hypothetical protein